MDIENERKLKLKKNIYTPDLVPKDFVNQFKFGILMSSTQNKKHLKIITENQLFLQIR
jgi:hypothetical protein